MDFRTYLLIEELDQFESAAYSINPASGKTWRSQERASQLEAIVAHQESLGVPESDLWVTFSDVQRLGIKPTARDGSTPMGLYAYPINYVINQIKKDPINDRIVPFGGDRAWMLIFKATRHNLITMKADQQTSQLANIRDSVRFVVDIKGKAQNYLDEIQAKISKFIRKIADSNLQEYLQTILSDIFYSIKYDSGSLTDIKNSIEKQINNIFEYNESDIENITEVLSNFEYSILKMNFINSYGMLYDLNSIDIKKETVKVRDYSWEKISAFDNLLGTFPFKKIHTFDEIFNLGLSHVKLPIDSDKFLILKTIDWRYDQAKLKRKLLEYKNTPQSERAIKFLKKLSKQLEPLYTEYASELVRAREEISFPFKDELIKECDKLRVDWAEILRATGSGSNTAHFVYKFTERLAKKGKKPDERYYVLWMKILRNLGITGISDEHGTGGIHSAERTQGVFFDPKHFTLLTSIINNKERFESPIFSQENNLAKHQRNQPSNRQKLYWHSDLNAHERTFFSLYQKLHQVQKNMYSFQYFSDILALQYSPSYFNDMQKFQVKSTLKRFTVLLKTYLKEKSTNSSRVSDEILKNTDSIVKSIIEMILKTEKAVTSAGFADFYKKNEELIKIHKKLANSLRMIFNISLGGTDLDDVTPKSSLKKLRPKSI